MTHESVTWQRCASAALAVVVLSGCGAADGDPESVGDDEVVGSVSQAFGEASCLDDVAGDAYITLGETAYSSPRTYSHPSCYKAVLVDYYGNTLFTPRVKWNDSLPTNESSCKSLYLAAEAFIWSPYDSDFFEYTDTKKSRGVWKNGKCSVPTLYFPETEFDYVNFRISATARTSTSSSAATRKLTVGWQRKLWPF